VEELPLAVDRQGTAPEDEFLPSPIAGGADRHGDEASSTPEVGGGEIGPAPRLQHVTFGRGGGGGGVFDQGQAKVHPLGVEANCRLHERDAGWHAGEAAGGEEITCRLAILPYDRDPAAGDVMLKGGCGEETQLIRKTLLQVDEEGREARRRDRDTVTVCRGNAGACVDVGRRDRQDAGVVLLSTNGGASAVMIGRGFART